jgi:hypothetical protein
VRGTGDEKGDESAFSGHQPRRSTSLIGQAANGVAGTFDT